MSVATWLDIYNTLILPKKVNFFAKSTLKKFQRLLDFAKVAKFTKSGHTACIFNDHKKMSDVEEKLFA